MLSQFSLASTSSPDENTQGDDVRATSTPIKIATGEYPPWIGAKLKDYGFIAKVIRQSFEHQGFSVEFTFYPWKRAYNQTRSGFYDATAYWYQSASRKEHFFYSEPLSIESTHLFYHKAKPLNHWDSLEDLKGLTIGATDGYTYTDEFWRLSRSGVLTVETTTKDSSNIAKLLHQRIDVFPIEKHLGFSILHKNFKPHLVHLIDFHPKPLMETTGHLLFPKSLNTSASLISEFNQGLAKLRETGRYQEMLDDMWVIEE
ncbi:substrate-binding periplasmic protein [Litoribrevibacter euphylliae]|uniref:Substrate-binding periplasmic protein n=1 Tax=Litoribrevibacter euphylliae TaxID=1834034 RepID=A0ABV7HHV6_9GAMM